MNYIIEQNQELWDSHVDLAFGEWVKKQGIMSSALDDSLFETFLEEYKDALEEDFIIRYKEIIDETIQDIVDENEKLKGVIKSITESSKHEAQVLQASLHDLSMYGKKIGNYCADLAVKNNTMLEKIKDNVYNEY